MKRHRYHLSPHAKEETIPLRTGVIPKSPKVFLDEIEEDPDGTDQQTKGQRESGNYHILANVWLSESGQERLPGLWRLVVVEPKEHFQDPMVITLLPPDRNSAKSEANMTDFLKKERRENDKPWLTPEYIATTLHSLLVDGQLRNQNDLSNHLHAVVMQPVIAAKDAAERQSVEERRAKEAAEQQSSQDQMAKAAAERGKERAEREAQEAISRVAEVNEKNKRLTNENELMANALADIKANFTSETRSRSPKEPAKAVTRPWQSKTGSDYMNIGMEASVVDVYSMGTQIVLTYIDEHGDHETVKDFFQNPFVQPVFDYLKSCKDQNRRAVFILTNKPNQSRSLASNTMMYGTYKNLWLFK